MPAADEILALIPWRYGGPPPEQRRIADQLQAHLAFDVKVDRAAIGYVEHWDAMAVTTADRLLIGFNKFFRVKVEEFPFAEIERFDDRVDERIHLVVRAPARLFEMSLLRTPENEAFQRALAERLRPKPSISFTPFGARRPPT